MDARTKANLSTKPFSILAYTAALLVAIFELAELSGAAADNLCHPILTLSEVQFSPIKAPKLQRNWTAVVSVDAAKCAVNSGGHFDIVFTRVSETAPDLEFRQRFAWSPFSRNIELDFAADEAVAAYRIENVTPCVCHDQAVEDRAAEDRAGGNGWRKQ